MTAPRLGRRSLLRGAAGLAVPLPWLEAMAPRGALAAAAPRRLVIFFSPIGTDAPDQFMPVGAGTSFTLGRETDPLMPFKKQALILSGIRNQSAINQMDVGDGHSQGMSHMLTCTPSIKADGFDRGDEQYFASWAGGASIDQKIAQGLAGQAPLSSLELGVQANLSAYPGPFMRMIYEDKLRPRAPQDDPREVYSKLFSGSSPTGTTSVSGYLEQRRSVLDFVMEDYRRLGSRLGVSDRRKLDFHLQGIRQIEQGLIALPLPTTCVPPGKDTYEGAITDGSMKDPKQFPAIGKLQMDLLTLALACDRTRVASIQWSQARSQVLHSWIGCRDYHHSLTHHEPADQAQLSEINRWYATQLAHQLGALAAVNEGDGTLLDNSVVWWCSEVSVGYAHTFHNMRAFLFGGCGGFFNTGRHVQLGDEPQNKLMVTLMHAMGLTKETEFGDRSISSGPLTGLG